MEKSHCKYCGAELTKIKMPNDNDWGAESVAVCMNDECGYYVRGWDWMLKNYKVKASYRYHYNSVLDYEGPLAVATPDDFKSSILV